MIIYLTKSFKSVKITLANDHEGGFLNERENYISLH